MENDSVWRQVPTLLLEKAKRLKRKRDIHVGHTSEENGWLAQVSSRFNKNNNGKSVKFLMNYFVITVTEEGTWAGTAAR